MVQALLLSAPVAGYVVGAVPFSNIAARLFGNVDLRDVGTRTVTPRNLRHAVGIWPALLAGMFEVAKGMVGPVMAGRGHLMIGALAAALAVTGHNWSIFLKGAGGRGLSTMTGALCILAWPGAAVMCAGLILGAVTRRVGPAMCVAVAALLPVLAVTNGPPAALAGLLLLAPMAVKTASLVRRRGLPSRPFGA
jgi:glycerol-3-phosphate acyltransferase PlsY